MNISFDQLNQALSDLLPTTGTLNLRKGLIPSLDFNYEIEVTIEDLRGFLDEGTPQQVQPLASFIRTANSVGVERLRPQPEDRDASTPESSARRAWTIKQLGLTELTSEIEAILPDPEPVVIVEDNYKDWYTEDREQHNNHYFSDYVKVLEKNGWDAAAIRSVDDQAREVMRRLEDPTGEHYRSTRGLVVGYVQSGKTANFTAVAAKAIDAGYRFVIVLAGTLDNLRNQTQRRLDKELFGREAVLDGTDEENLTVSDYKSETYYDGDAEFDSDWASTGYGFVTHGADYGTLGFPRVKRITTSKNDFMGSNGASNPIDFQVPFADLPVYHPDNIDRLPVYVAVVKKNASRLEKLNNQLDRARRVNPALADLPLLVIDDESDQASINTKDNRKKDENEEVERTAVNAQITTLLSHNPRAQYVGYTATPFANVFVNPNDPEDLYPRHFVLMLNEPPAYRGAKWFHDSFDFADNPEDATIENSQSKAFIRLLAEAEDLDEESFEERRKEELQEALNMFVLTGGLKKFREEVDGVKFKHHTMLVHEHVGTEIHTAARDLLVNQWNASGFSTGGAWNQLEALFNKDIHPVSSHKHYRGDYSLPESFQELKPYITAAVKEMLNGVERSTPGNPRGPILQVDTVGEDVPNFEEGKVWKVLVGGAKLSRGYTVEGLSVSYFRRIAGGADTLMQTGRWFGFRKGYQDLVRLYAPESLVRSFEAAMMDEESFRDEVKIYSQKDANGKPQITPMQLAPLVHQSLPDLKPTSRNKMFNAFITRVASAPTPVEFNSIPDPSNKKDLAFNFVEIARPMLEHLGSNPVDFAWLRAEGARSGNLRFHSGSLQMNAGIMSSRLFIELLEKMKWYEGSGYKENNVNPRINYLYSLIGRGSHASAENSDFTEVAVLLSHPKNARYITVDGLDWKIPLVKRTRRVNRHDITGTDRKITYAMRNIAEGYNPTEIQEDHIKQVREAQPDCIIEQPPVKTDEPFGHHPSFSSTRGSVLLTIFDDRTDAAKEKAEERERLTGNWIEPDPMKGEIGVALAFNSPHSPLIGTDEQRISWAVHLAGDKVIVDAKEVDEEEDLEFLDSQDTGTATEQRADAKHPARNPQTTSEEITGVRFAIALNGLEPHPPISENFGRKYFGKMRNYSSQRAHLMGWFRQLDGPGAYNRKSSRNAKQGYNGFQDPWGLVWLAEALGEKSSVVERAADEAGRVRDAGGNNAACCAAVRRVIPWDRIEELITPRLDKPIY